MPTLSTFEFSRTTVLVSAFVLFGLIVSNAALVVQNRNLKESMQKGEVALVEGQSMPAIAGMDLEGREQIFDWGKDNRKTLLMNFSPRCGYCRANMPNWTAILQGIDKLAYRVVLVSSISDGAKEYIEKYNIKDVPVIVEPEPKVLVNYLMHITPQTVLLNSDGKIEKVWVGKFVNEQKPYIEQSLNVSLP